jgi:hypothetical protein
MLFINIFVTFTLLLIVIVGMHIALQIEGFAYTTIYDHPTKCFSCERDAIRRFGPKYAWLGQNTKSFDAEREMIRMTGDVSSAIDTHPIKYY